jgi:hypothetical protein
MTETGVTRVWIAWLPAARSPDDRDITSRVDSWLLLLDRLTIETRRVS